MLGAGGYERRAAYHMICIYIYIYIYIYNNIIIIINNIIVIISMIIFIIINIISINIYIYIYIYIYGRKCGRLWCFIGRLYIYIYIYIYIYMCVCAYGCPSPYVHTLKFRASGLRLVERVCPNPWVQIQICS